MPLAPSSTLADSSASLAEARVLIVEDNFLLAYELAGIVEHAGGMVIGPCPDVASALTLLRETNQRISCALLDVLLGDTSCYAVARELRAMGCGIVFVTGMPPQFICEAYRDYPVCVKPVDRGELVHQLRKDCSSSHPAPRFA